MYIYIYIYIYIYMYIYIYICIYIYIYKNLLGKERGAEFCAPLGWHVAQADAKENTYMILYINIHLIKRTGQRGWYQYTSLYNFI